MLKTKNLFVYGAVCMHGSVFISLILRDECNINIVLINWFSCLVNIIPVSALPICKRSYVISLNSLSRVPYATMCEVCRLLNTHSSSINTCLFLGNSGGAFAFA